MHFKAISDYFMAGFLSRGVLVYRYNASGSLGNPAPLKSVSMNGVASRYSAADSWYATYIMYSGYSSIPNVATLPEWRRTEKFSANVRLVIADDYVKLWPGLSIQAGRYTRDDWPNSRDSSGGAYVSRDGTNGSCKMVDPEKPPPPPPINITVTAPDWDLGELPVGEGSKTFSGSSEALCFSYTPTAVSGKRFSIDAGSANGVMGNRYRLRGVDDINQYVPYDMVLDSGSSTLKLPNTGNVAIELSASGRTCFVPTFRTTVDRKVKAGTYNDVLTFTVTTGS